MADDELGRKPATEQTRRANEAVAASLGLRLDDQADLERATRGFLAAHSTGTIARGAFPSWDVHAHDFVRDEPNAPDSVNPSLWRHARLNCTHGLFQVSDRVWQVRGYDLANITFIAGESGWIVIDPLTVAETAAAALALANETLGERPVVAVIYTHSHVDHFGGVEGVTTAADVAAGRCEILAPEGFLHEVIGENVIAGPAMLRRSMYMFAPLLPTGVRGQIDAGLGKTVAVGSVGLIPPTDEICATGEERTVDGVRIVFQMTPDAEAPAEMNFHFPDLRVLCMAENCTHNLHNLLTPRGAQVRDALSWSKYIHEAIGLFADDTDVCFASHHWPRFGADDVREFLTRQRDLYRWLHDQTMRLTNHGLTPIEIAEQLELAPELAEEFSCRGYYGTVNFNVKAIYQRYLGFFDGNPTNLHPHPPERTAAKTVEYMGGADAVLARAHADFAAGDYRWVAQVVHHVVFAEPDNDEARTLLADALEQLGYQAESAVWRNFYLSGAHELRHGILELGNADLGGMAPAMTTDMLFDAIAVRMIPDRLAEVAGSVRVLITDRDEAHVIGVSSRTLFHAPAPGPGSESDVSAGTVDPILRCTSTDLIAIANGHADAATLDIDGDRTVIDAVVGAVDVFPRVFPIVTP